MKRQQLQSNIFEMWSFTQVYIFFFLNKSLGNGTLHLEVLLSLVLKCQYRI